MIDKKCLIYLLDYLRQSLIFLLEENCPGKLCSLFFLFFFLFLGSKTSSNYTFFSLYSKHTSSFRAFTCPKTAVATFYGDQ